MRQYQILASFAGLRPGVKLPGGRTASLLPDALTAALLKQGNLAPVLTNFNGTLDPSGRPVNQPVVNIPASAPRGLRVFLVAIAFNPRAPGGLDVTEPWAFTID